MKNLTGSVLRKTTLAAVAMAAFLCLANPDIASAQRRGAGAAPGARGGQQGGGSYRGSSRPYAPDHYRGSGGGYRDGGYRGGGYRGEGYRSGGYRGYRPNYYYGPSFGYGYGYGYSPAYVAPACGYYDRWGYWRSDPACYYDYYGPAY